MMTARGRVAERLKAPVLKTGRGVTLSWVRIPPLPPYYSLLTANVFVILVFDDHVLSAQLKSIVLTDIVDLPLYVAVQ
jgi:hypothetical protein